MYSSIPFSRLSSNSKSFSSIAVWPAGQLIDAAIVDIALLLSVDYLLKKEMVMLKVSHYY